MLLFACSNVISQNEWLSFSESTISLNHDVQRNYKLNFSLKSRSYLYSEDQLLIKHRHLDFIHFSTLSLSPKTNLSLGLQYRNRNWFEDGSNELRSTLQLGVKSISNKFRFGHRFRMEQRFFDTSTVFRFRYRLAFDMPLNGEKLNVGESYFVAMSEFLYALEYLMPPDYDHRWSAQIGWLLAQNTRLQLGLEYRFGKLKINPTHSLYFYSTMVLNI
jgi:hypothetical protein